MSYLKNFKYDLYGPESGEKVVFLHGVMGSGANWRRIVPALQNTYRILTFDQRGHGWSFKPETGYTPDDYARDLKLILDELHWDQVILIGHSMGGRNALRFADLFPERVRALVVEDIGPQGKPEAMKKTIEMVEMVPVPFISKVAAKDYFQNEFVQRLGGGEKAKMLGQYFYTNIEEQKNGTADWRFSKNAILSTVLEGHFQSLWDFIDRLSMPTLFVRGEHSQDFPREEYLRVLAANPRIQGVEIPDAGHWVHADQAELFTAALLRFLLSLTNRT